MSNHGVLCQTNVSLYLQFLNCASKNCLFLILFSLPVSPSSSFCTQQSQSNLVLFFHTILTPRMPQVKALHHITTLFFLGEFTTECWNFPRLPLQCFNYWLFSFPGKREKNQQELTDFSSVLKGEFHYMQHHVMLKKNKPNHPRNSKQNQQYRLYMIFKGNHLQVWPNLNRIMVMLRPWWRQSITKEKKTHPKNETHSCCYIWNNKIQTKIVQYLAELSSG